MRPANASEQSSFPVLAFAESKYDMLTVEEFARCAHLSRRQIDRLRKSRLSGFPRQYELGSGKSKYRSCPRFKRSEVEQWLDSRALW